jgi:hypothetical protein
MWLGFSMWFWVSPVKKLLNLSASNHAKFLRLITSLSTDVYIAQPFFRIAQCDWNMLQSKLTVNQDTPYSSLPNP